MPTIVMASSKGGCGKSTLAVLIATELVAGGAATSVIDADPNETVVRWGRKTTGQGPTVIAAATEDTLIDTIERAAADTAFVVVDLEGTAHLMVAQAMSRADLVLIPMKASVPDLTEGVKVIRFLKQQEKAYRRDIPYAVVLTQTSAAVRPRSLRDIEDALAQQDIPRLSTQLHERDAYRALFAHGGDLSSLPKGFAPNVPAARSNARKILSEVIALLKSHAKVKERVA